jgi:hypothetical protein
MNDLYHRYLTESHVPNSLLRLASSAITPPSSLWFSPTGVYGFPPALVPLLQGSGPCYLGYWNHWFVSRLPTYVEASPFPTFSVNEYARTPEQFSIRLVLNLIEMNGGSSADIQEFAAILGVRDYGGLLHHWQASGEAESELGRLPVFTGQTPRGRAAVHPGYKGSFPSWDFADQRAWWHSACSLEIDPVIFSQWPTHLAVPEHLTGNDGFQRFKSYIDRGRLDYAWLILNSSGWEIKEAQAAMELLQAVASDSKFTLLADAWLDASDRFQSFY